MIVVRVCISVTCPRAMRAGIPPGVFVDSTGEGEGDGHQVLRVHRKAKTDAL
jgi:hypothetical protein